MPAKRSYGSGGLTQEERAGGRKVWVATVRPDGGRRKRRKVLGLVRRKGEKDGITKADAEAGLRAFIIEINGAPPETDRARELTVSDAKALYLRHLEVMQRKASHKKTTEQHLRTWVEPWVGETPLSALTKHDFEDIRIRMTRAGLSPKYIRNVCATYATLLNYCVKEGHLTTSTADLGRIPQAPRSPDLRFLTIDEVNLLLVHVRPGARQELMRALFLTAAMTGMRVSELRALHWEDVDFVGAGIRVHRNVETRYVPGHTPGVDDIERLRANAEGTPKTKKSNRRIPMADRVAVALDRLYQSLGAPPVKTLVFPGQDGKPLGHSSINDNLHDALRAAGLPDHHVFHDFRHTFATQMVSASPPVSLTKLQEWMGHEDIQTLMIYAHFQSTNADAGVIGAAFASSRPKEPGAEVPPEWSRRLIEKAPELTAEEHWMDEPINALLDKHMGP